MFKQMGGAGVKGFLNNVKKTALFSHDGFPKMGLGWVEAALAATLIFLQLYCFATFRDFWLS